MTSDADRIAQLYDAFQGGDFGRRVAMFPEPNGAGDGLAGHLTGAHARLFQSFQTIGLEISVLNYALEPDDRARARSYVTARGPGGGPWQDDVITVWYRLERGLIAEQDIDDSGRDGNAP